MDHGKGLKNRGTFASEASGPQKLEKLHLGGNLKFFGYGTIPGCHLFDTNALPGRLKIVNSSAE